MQEELNLKEWVIDEKTGYLKNPIRKQAITPEQKTSFLEALKTLGSEAAAAKFAGFSTRILSVHKRGDKKFKEDFDLTLQEMANTLEGVMYLNAQQPRGTLDRFGWLRAHFPKKWNQKFQEEKKDVKKTIDALWDEVQQDKK